MMEIMHFYSNGFLFVTLWAYFSLILACLLGKPFPSWNL